jgi:hypothetical protein
MRVLITTEPGTPGADNEDFAAACPDAVVLLDGASAPAGLESGCIHSVAWYARTLGGLLLAAISDHRVSLVEALAACIDRVNGLHSGTCDLDHPGTPSATVSAVRAVGDQLEYLVLSDSVLIIEHTDQPALIITDDRLVGASLKLAGYPTPEPGTEFLTRVRRLADFRNKPGGFWVANTNPDAARQALVGSVPSAGVSTVVQLSDGASRVVDRFHLLTWPEALTILHKQGPQALISRTRDAENSDPDCARWPRSKASDDATVVYWPLGN